MWLSWPARLSSSTSAPSAAYFSATAGTSATRVSPDADSLGTPMLRAIDPPTLMLNPDEGSTSAFPQPGGRKPCAASANRAARDQPARRRTATDTDPTPTCVVSTA